MTTVSLTQYGAVGDCIFDAVGAGRIPSFPRHPHSPL
nr:MAG TPA: hypothetical protein [Caudoviricetes sp.]